MLGPDLGLNKPLSVVLHVFEVKKGKTVGRLRKQLQDQRAFLAQDQSEEAVKTLRFWESKLRMAEAAWDAALDAELDGGALDAGYIAILLDLSKCYERIPLKELATRAVEAGWPGKMVALAVGQYVDIRSVSVAEATVSSLRENKMPQSTENPI